jgi:hypothetical protein
MKRGVKSQTVNAYSGSNYSIKYQPKHYLWKNEGSPRSEQIFESINPNKEVNKE